MEILNSFIKLDNGTLFEVDVDAAMTVHTVIEKIWEKEMLGRRGIVPSDLDLYAPSDLFVDSEEILLQRADVQGLPCLRLRKKVEEVVKNVANPDLVHIVVVPRPTATSSVIPAKRLHSNDDKDICESVNEAKLANNAPSRMTPSNYRALQTDPRQRILDDRPKRDVVPPIALLYDGFGHFYDICEGRTDVLGLDQVNQVATRATVDVFAEAMNKTYDTESERSTAVREGLNDIFRNRSGTRIPPFIAASIGLIISDGHIIGDHRGLVGVVEIRNEEAQISAMPAIKAVSYAAHSHKVDMRNHQDVLRGWRVPSLGLTVVGNKITFYAIILLDQYRTVELAAASCNLGAKDEKDRETLKTAFVAASVLLARILEDATKHVNGCHSEIPKVYRRMPAITTLPGFGAEDLDPVEFQIQDYHYDKQPYRHVFIALENKENKEIIVKFTRQYSIDLHAFCMRLGYAPRILGYTPKTLPGGWYAIAMEYVEKAQLLTKAVRLAENINRWENELNALVKSYHAEGFVHGDLRDSNIVCDGDKMMLIDFDWGGRADQVSYPIRLDELDKDLLEGRTNSDPKITRDDDIRVLEIDGAEGTG